MGDVTYKHDFSGLRELAVAPEMQAMLLDRAYAARDYAISISPDAPPYGAGYIDSFEVEGGHTERHAGLKRSVVYLWNRSDHAWFVERGTKVSQNLGHHVLARTADWLERS